MQKDQWTHAGEMDSFDVIEAKFAELMVSTVRWVWRFQSPVTSDGSPSRANSLSVRVVSRYVPARGLEVGTSGKF
eukprot:1181558-Prorocentrum_minimum.AAC.1